MSLMANAFAKLNAQQNLTQQPVGVSGAPMSGPANKALPAGSSGVGLDAFHAARQEALGKFQALQANPAVAVKQLGRDGYLAALRDAQALAQKADAEYRMAATKSGVGMFTE